MVKVQARKEDRAYPKQRELYPDLAPIAFGGPPADAYRSAEATATRLGWEVQHGNGLDHIEATGDRSNS